jgi:hypothetical protein
VTPDTAISRQFHWTKSQTLQLNSPNCADQPTIFCGRLGPLIASRALLDGPGPAFDEALWTTVRIWAGRMYWCRKTMEAQVEHCANSLCSSKQLVPLQRRYLWPPPQPRAGPRTGAPTGRSASA